MGEYTYPLVVLAFSLALGVPSLIITYRQSHPRVLALRVEQKASEVPTVGGIRRQLLWPAALAFMLCASVGAFFVGRGKADSQVRDARQGERKAKEDARESNLRAQESDWLAEIVGREVSRLRIDAEVPPEPHNVVPASEPSASRRELYVYLGECQSDGTWVMKLFRDPPACTATIPAGGVVIKSINGSRVRESPPVTQPDGTSKLGKEVPPPIRRGGSVKLLRMWTGDFPQPQKKVRIYWGQIERM